MTRAGVAEDVDGVVVVILGGLSSTEIQFFMTRRPADRRPAAGG